MGTGPFPLEDYLDRIGLGERPAPPSLAEVHRAHVVAIPFENLDPHRGVPVSLQPAALARKLVHERRGGYCFEHNSLLAAGLEALGARVELMLARVRLGRPPGRTSPRTHLVLRVHAGGEVWLADAGFGNGTLLEPIPFGPGGVHDQSGWRFRIVADGREHVLQAAREGGWDDLYGFVPEPVPPVDLETSNWFTATHPRSPFVTGLIAAAHRADGSRVTMSDWDGLSLTEETPTDRTVIAIERTDVPRLLDAQFGLPGFALADSGRIVRPG
ncbi:MAG TPA: arylamine N-acetyltransferase [Solirubrobacteraceae bacterium]|jgi:N-hydroxyarylamine O-acetyltransferase|nr:arylamine N-acetyltransferase [Solirubrobacteraceae bacterium]